MNIDEVSKRPGYSLPLIDLEARSGHRNKAFILSGLRLCVHVAIAKIVQSCWVTSSEFQLDVTGRFLIATLIASLDFH